MLGGNAWWDRSLKRPAEDWGYEIGHVKGEARGVTGVGYAKLWQGRGRGAGEFWQKKQSLVHLLEFAEKKRKCPKCWALSDPLNRDLRQYSCYTPL